VSTPFVLTSLGESVDRAVITRWLKSVGDTVEADEPLLEVATDKVATEITAPHMGGVDIPAGTTVMVLNGAANRDPRQIARPETFDVSRPNAPRHIAFGRGVHSCPGAPLARAEARVCIERILDRTTDIRISEEHHGPADARRFQYVPTYILRGLT
jgi:cytochrome P450